MPVREVVESPLRQGINESISYHLDTRNYGGTPTSPSVTISNVTNGAYIPLTVEEMAVVMPANTPSVSGDTIILSPLKNLTILKTYRVEVKFTSGGDILEPYFLVMAEN